MKSGGPTILSVRVYGSNILKSVFRRFGNAQVKDQIGGKQK